MRQASQGEKYSKALCSRRLWAETLRTARGPKCWSRSVEPLPEECGTPTRAMSQLVGSESIGQRKREATPHQGSASSSTMSSSDIGTSGGDGTPCHPTADSSAVYRYYPTE